MRLGKKKNEAISRIFLRPIDLTILPISLASSRLFSQIRWNSTFQMLDRLLEHQTIIDTVVRRRFDGLTRVQADRLKLAAFTPDDWDVLRALHHVLMGFYQATAIVSASLYPTLSDSFWALRKLRQILLGSSEQSRYQELMKRSLLNYLDIYTVKHLSNEQQQSMLVSLCQWFLF